MKICRELKFASALFVAGLVCAGCKKEQQSPAPPPVVTSAPTAAAPKPGLAEKVLSPQEAKNHIGEYATVRGQVFGVHVTQKGDVFINMGGAFPNQPFTAACFQGAIPAEDLKKLEGKIVSVKGPIKDYNGQVEIVLERADQISE